MPIQGALVILFVRLENIHVYTDLQKFTHVWNKQSQTKLILDYVSGWAVISYIHLDQVQTKSAEKNLDLEICCAIINRHQIHKKYF